MLKEPDAGEEDLVQCETLAGTWGRPSSQRRGKNGTKSLCIKLACRHLDPFFWGYSLHLFSLETTPVPLSPQGSGWAKPTSYFQGWACELD